MAEKTYDVVLMRFGPGRTERPAQAVARVIAVTEEEGESLIRNAPRAVCSNVDYATAEAYAASLSVAGAEVAIAVHPFDVTPREVNAPVEPLTARSTEPPAPASAPPAENTAEGEPARPSLPERDSRIMGVLSRAPGAALRPGRVVAVALLVVLAYGAWLLLLDRM